VGLVNGFLFHHYYESNAPKAVIATHTAATTTSVPRGRTDVTLPLSEISPEDDRSKLPGSVRRRPIDSHFIVDAAKAASPAVVAIQSEVAVPSFFGVNVGMSFGSGFLIDQEGTIVTNAHVVGYVPEESPVTIRLADGDQLQAKVVAKDTMSDLAVLRVINTDKNRKFPCVKLGSSADLCPGEWVTAIGSPLTLQNSVTCGVVSNVDRSDYELGIESRTSYLQFDAGITSGNSGGPLVNLDGEVVGVNCMKAATESSIGFAIPIDTAKDIIRQLLEKGKVERPYVGLTMVALSPDIKEELKSHGYKLSSDVESGVLIVDAIERGPVARAGLKADDIIIEIDGHPVRTSKDVLRRLGEPGKPIRVKVLRKNKEIEKEVVPDVLPDNTQGILNWRNRGGMGHPRHFP